MRRNSSRGEHLVATALAEHVAARVRAAMVRRNELAIVATSAAAIAARVAARAAAGVAGGGVVGGGEVCGAGLLDEGRGGGECIADIAAHLQRGVSCW